MKSCYHCGTQVLDDARFCPKCGSPDLAQMPSAEFAPMQGNVPPQMGVYPPMPAAAGNSNGNLLLGILGAALFSLLGGVVYFLVYQLGVVAGICGLVIFLLARFGYNLFSKATNKNSLVGLIASVVGMVVMIYLAEYFCIAYALYEELSAYGGTFSEALALMPEFLKEPEVSEAFVSDLAFSYVFGFLASIGNIVNIFKARKQGVQG